MKIRSELLNSSILIIISGLITKVYSGFEFTNIKCVSADKKFCDYEYCYLKSINRTYKYASVKLRLHQLPITEVSIHFNLAKRLNGYKPFLYNMTMNVCEYMRKPHGFKVAAFFHSLIKPYSNINHTCPYTGDVFVEKLPISFMDYKLTKILPFPEGDYRIAGNVITQKKNSRIYHGVFQDLTYER